MYLYLNVEKLIKKSKMKAEYEISQYMEKKKYESGKLVSNGDDLLMTFAKLDADRRGKFFLIKNFWIAYLCYGKYYGQKDVCILLS